jgi:UDPglucose 6-dehydrogenase
MRGNILVDLRNVWDPREAERAGFIYVGIGRGKLPG